MLDYQTLDTIADAYSPLLALIALFCIFYSAKKLDWKKCRAQVALLLGGLFIIYGLKYLDIFFNIWSLFSLDYSTHTAFAWVFILFLIVNLPKYWMVLTASFVSYMLLMLYQGYHGIGDIISTVIVISLMMLPMVLLYKRQNSLTLNKE
jgi:hypothetical protein